MREDDDNQNQNMDTALKALDRLVRTAEQKPETFEEFSKELSGQNSDRSAAILVAAQVEDALDMVIRQRMRLKSKRERELFSSSGPLGSFYCKIVFAHALNIFGKETRRNLDLIRSIRNAFAHAKVSLSFCTPEIRDVLNFLAVPAVVPPHVHPLPELPDPLEGRELYKTVCDRTSHNLVWWWLSAGVVLIDKGAVKVPLPREDYEISAVRPPLP